MDVCPHCGRCPACGQPVPGITITPPWPGYPRPYIGDPPGGWFPTTTAAPIYT